MDAKADLTASSLLKGPDPACCRYIAFLSHYKHQAAAEARVLKMVLSNQGAKEAFLDSDNLMDLRSLLKAANESKCLLLLLTRDVLSRPWVLQELHETYTRGIKFACVHLEGLPPSRAYYVERDQDSFTESVASLRRSLDSRNPGATKEIEKKACIALDSLRLSLLQLLSRAVWLPFNISASQRVQAAQARDILTYIEDQPFQEAEDLKCKCELPSGKDFLVYISYFKGEASNEANILKHRLEEGTGCPIFIDADFADDVTRRLDVVSRSAVLLLVQTKKVLSQPSVLLECDHALKEGVPVVAVSIQGKEYKFQEVDTFLADLRTSLARPCEAGGNPDAIELLECQGADIEAMAWRLSCSIPYIISKGFSANATSKNVLQAQINDLIDNVLNAEPKTFAHTRTEFEDLSFSSISKEIEPFEIMSAEDCDARPLAPRRRHACQYCTIIRIIATLLVICSICFLGFWSINRADEVIDSKNFLEDSTIHEAVDYFCQGGETKDAVERKYGHISRWETARITNMTNLFRKQLDFNQDLNNWNVSSVTTMMGMFESAVTFNRNLSAWNVANVKTMSRMFQNARSFSGDLSAWNVARVTAMQKMFASANAFNGDLNAWNVASVKTMSHMFEETRSFKSNLNAWRTSCVTDISHMFRFALAFNGDLSAWNVSHVTTMKGMFAFASSFNGDLSPWNVSAVTNMGHIFYGASAFNSHLNAWNVASVTDMARMFADAKSFNGDVSAWTTAQVTTMASMFQGVPRFNGTLSAWNVSKVTSMSGMFQYATRFNDDLSAWNVAKVMSMSNMFYDAEAFNGNLSAWNIGKVESARAMFRGAHAFKGGLSAWNMSGVIDGKEMFTYAKSFTCNLSAWNVAKVMNMDRMFSHAEAFNSNLSAWNASQVSSMQYMFLGATSFNGDLSAWDVANVTSMHSMFFGASAFNGDLSAWNVSKVTSMHSMFRLAKSFNGDISVWDVSQVKDMSYMFEKAILFNANLSAWNVGSRTETKDMFEGTPISSRRKTKLA